MLLYVHVPFCRKRCCYCAFHSSAIGQGPVPHAYVPTLLKELRIRALSIPKEKRSLSSVFFGGGTPSLLEAKDVGALLEGMAKVFRFERDIEISLEGNPESLCESGKLDGLFACGVNRLSVGVQSMDEETLRRLGRIHGTKEVEQTVDMARKAGFQNIGMDLIWALPGQTADAWRKTLKKALNLHPEHVSAYSLSVEEGTPLHRQSLKAPLNLPGEEEEERMYVEGTALLEAAGLEHYEISNYARTGRRCRHNMGYWQGQEYLGLGPAAVSTLEGIRQTNPFGLEPWTRWVEGGARTEEAQELETLDSKTALLECVMLSLRTSEGVRFGDYKRRFGRDFPSDFGTLLPALEKNGYLKWTEGGVALTLRGMLVSNAVIESFFEQAETLNQI